MLPGWLLRIIIHNSWSRMNPFTTIFSCSCILTFWYTSFTWILLSTSKLIAALRIIIIEENHFPNVLPMKFSTELRVNRFWHVHTSYGYELLKKNSTITTKPCNCLSVHGPPMHNCGTSTGLQPHCAWCQIQRDVCFFYCSVLWLLHSLIPTPFPASQYYVVHTEKCEGPGNEAMYTAHSLVHIRIRYRGN